MALKDLTTKGSVLTEKQVEEIIADYINYDQESKEVILLPAAGSLTNRGKVLVYLVALQGWPFITKDPVSTEASPASIEKVLNIPGGTLRPTLKELKDSHFILKKGRAYRVHAATLTKIKEEIQIASKKEQAPKTSRRRKSRSKATAGEPAPKRRKAKQPKARRESDGELAKAFDKLISEGFFDSPRVLKDVQDRLRDKGIIVSRTTLPKYLLTATRKEKLSREQKKVGKKTSYVYKRKK